MALVLVDVVRHRRGRRGRRRSGRGSRGDPERVAEKGDELWERAERGTLWLMYVPGLAAFVLCGTVEAGNGEATAWRRFDFQATARLWRRLRRWRGLVLDAVGRRRRTASHGRRNQRSCLLSECDACRDSGCATRRGQGLHHDSPRDGTECAAGGCGLRRGAELCRRMRRNPEARDLAFRNANQFDPDAHAVDDAGFPPAADGVLVDAEDHGDFFQAQAFGAHEAGQKQSPGSSSSEMRRFMAAARCSRRGTAMR